MNEPVIPREDPRPDAPFWLTALIFLMVTAAGAAGGVYAAAAYHLLCMKPGSGRQGG